MRLHSLRGCGPLIRRDRRGLSVVLIAIILLFLVGFVSLAVDVGRVRVVKTQLQNAADAAACAGASGLEFLPDGVVEPQDRAYDAAAENYSLDQAEGTGEHGGRADSSVNLVVDEDVEFGIWRESTRTFEKLEQQSGGIDERREANAVRVFGRRMTEFKDSDGNTIQRGTGLPLIFAPVVGVATGEVQADATAAITGGPTGYGFVGIDWVKMNGTTKTDSYHAATESYPGADGTPNKLGTISSNGDIELVGGATVWGDVHPGVEGHITPYPLGGNVDVTGFMDPLEAPLTFAMPPFSPPAAGALYPTGPGSITPANAYNKSNGTFAPKSNGTTVTIKTGSYLFSSWTTGSQDQVEIDNSGGPVTIWVNGDVKSTAQAGVKITSDAWPVTFHVNGDFKMDGGGIFNAATTAPGVTPAYIAKPANLVVNVCKAGTSVDIGGSPTASAHIYAPGSDVKVHGNANGVYGYYGTIIGKSLFVTGGAELHYDESGDLGSVPFTVRLVD